MTNSPRYVSTSKAATILGVSATLVKSLVDERKLQAWKTQGGHRRISLESIEAYICDFERSDRAARRTVVAAPPPPALPVPPVPQMTLMVQSPELLAALQACMQRGAPSAMLALARVARSPAQALQGLDPRQPQLVVLELTGSAAEQERELLLLGHMPAGVAPVTVLVVTPHHGLRLPVRPPEHCCVHVFSGPVSLDWAQGCLVGLLTLLSSMQGTLPRVAHTSMGALAGTPAPQAG